MKHYYKLSMLMLGLLLAGHVNAQQTFTLDQCIDYALKNSINVQNSVLDEQIASAKVKETIGIGLPQISIDGSLVHNPKLSRFFTTYSGPDGFLGDLSGVPGIQPGDVIAARNFFQLQSSGGASIGLNQLLFNGSYLVGLKASSVYRDLAVKTGNQTKEQIIQQVMKAYYAVLINKERIDLFANNIARVDSLLSNTKALNENGFAEAIDVDRIQVTLNNLLAERNKFLNLNDLGIEVLKFQMNYPMDQPLEVVGSINEVQVDTNLEHYKEGWDYKIRPDYQVLETNRKLQALNVKNQNAAFMPTLNAFATFGYSTQSPQIAGLFQTNTQIEDYGGLGPDTWYNYSQIGVSLNIPIFSGGQRYYKLQQEKIALSKVDNGFRSLKNGIDLEIKQASLIFENAIATLETQQANMDLASRVAQVTKLKYEQGVGSNIEVVDAENSLRQAQTNYYGAMFDAMVAKVDLDKAYGKLLPIVAESSK
ncbi:MAG TPA: TolC family protein [Cyclobacteriaceae bacterium]|nr:TolC family protein [Cyclobacteriaceae bacterium]